MKNFSFVLLVLFLSGLAHAEIKDLKCDLTLELGKPSNLPVVNISYDEKAYNSFKPVTFSLNEINFIGKRKTELNEFLNVEVESIESEKMILDIWHVSDYIVEEKLLVYMFISKEDANNPSINMYQCN